MPDPQIVFSAGTHTYEVDGKVRRSVTQVIEGVCPFRGKGETVELAADFGHALHLALAFLDRGTLDQYDPQLEPWIEGWRRFLADLPALSEKYCRVLVDIKSGHVSPTWPIQLAGYEIGSADWVGTETIVERMFYNERFDFAGTVDRVYFGQGRKDRRFCVQLTGSGDWKKHESKEPIEMEKNIFLSMLNVERWKRNHNLTRKDVDYGPGN